MLLFLAYKSMHHGHLQALWKPAHQRASAFWGSIPWYIIIFIIPTGIFTAACNSAAYALCNADPSISEQAFGWFCGSRFAQFLLTVLTPFILLMVWQNAFIPAWLYKLELRKGSAISLSQVCHLRQNWHGKGWCVNKALRFWMFVTWQWYTCDMSIDGTSVCCSVCTSLVSCPKLL